MSNSVEDALQWARVCAAGLAGEMHRQWSDTGETDQAIATWKQEFKDVGLDLDDVQTLWTVAVAIERAYSLVLTNFMCDNDEGDEFDEFEHFIDHLNYGLTPIIMTLDSAIKTHDAGPLPVLSE